MVDLVLDWSGSGVGVISAGAGQDGATSVETGGVAVDIAFDSQSDDATTYVTDQLGYIAPFVLDHCIAHPTDGAMGYHYFDIDLIDDISVAPQALR